MSAYPDYSRNQAPDKKKQQKLDVKPA
jgi:hypothetical protein